MNDQYNNENQNNEAQGTEAQGSGGYQPDPSANTTPPPFNNYYPPQPPIEPKKSNDTMGIISLILGIISVTFCCCCSGYLGLVVSAGAAVLAVLSRSNNQNRFSGLALAGLILGCVGAVIAVGNIISSFFVDEAAIESMVDSIFAAYGIEAQP